MAGEAPSTFLSIRLFSPHSSIPPETESALTEAMSEDLAKMVLPFNGTFVSGKKNSIIFQFTSDSPEKRTDLISTYQASLHILHRLAGFRITRDPTEQRSWSLQFGISSAHSRDLNEALTLAENLSAFAQPDQIIVDHDSFQSIHLSSIENWSLIESNADYGQTSQIIYRNQTPEVALPEELKSKCYQLSTPHLPTDEFLCFYYIGVMPAAGVAPAPILRLYSPKPLPLPVLSNEAGEPVQTQEMVLGRYTLQSVLGVGGMGQVWKARDTFGNPAALKMMLPGSAAAEGQIERFRREAEIMSKLPHHNICRIFEVGEAGGISYIAMELVEGLTLHELLHVQTDDSNPQSTSNISSLVRHITEEKKRPLAEGEKRKGINRVLGVEIAISVMGKMCDAIQFAHDHNILHRDLKPGNIMIREDGEPVVMDFGLGKLEKDEKTKDLSLTMEGAMLGTMQYMSPEQAMSSHTVDSRADVYSLGAILYEMLTGHHHFKVTGSLLQDAQTLQDYHPPSLSTLNGSIEKDLEMVVMKALHPEPDRRYRTPAALRADLERYLHGEAVTAKPVTFLDVLRRMYRRNKPLTIVSVASVLTLVFGTGYSLVQISQEKNIALTEKQRAEESAQRAIDALTLAKQKEAEALKASELAQKEKENAEEALRNMKKAQREREEVAAAKRLAEELNEKIKFEAESEKLKYTEQLAQSEEEKEKLAQERERENERRRKIEEKLKNIVQQAKGENDAEAEQIMLSEFPVLKQEIGRSRGFDPMFTLRLTQNISSIATRTTRYIEPRFLLGKTHFANGNFPEAFTAFTQVMQNLNQSKDSTIQGPLARSFFKLLQNNCKVDRDFFDETKGKVEIDHRSFKKEWGNMSKEDASLAARLDDPNSRLSDADRIAFLQFFTLLEKTP
jgi:serine/threonine protein kinase